jgi:hypothetical protein
MQSLFVSLEEVLPLASSRLSSNYPGGQDVVMNLEAFEAINTVTIEIRMRSSLRGGLADIVMTALAHPSAELIGEVPPLASVSRSYLGMQVKTLDAAVFQLLYALDAQLALREFESAKRSTE